MQTNPPLEKQLITVSGKVTNWKGNEHSVKAMYLAIDDFISSEYLKYKIQIEDDGSFETSIPKEHAQNFNLSTPYYTFTLYGEPGHKLYVEIDASRLEEDAEKALQFKGDFAEINRHIIDFKVFWNKRIRGFWEVHKKNITKLDGKDYKDFRIKRFKEDQEYFSDYLKNNKMNAEAQNWVNLGIKYQCADDLMRYRWYHPMQNKLDQNKFKLPDTYFDFFDEFELDKKDAVTNSNFNSYLSEYVRYMEKTIMDQEGKQNISKLIGLLLDQGELSDNDKTILKRNRNISLDQISKDDMMVFQTVAQRNEELLKTGYLAKQYNDYIEYIFTNLHGYTKDACISRFFYSIIDRKDELDLIKPSIERYKENVKTIFLKKRVLTRLDEVEKLLADLSPPEGAHLLDFPKGSTKNLFENFISKYKGKVVYIDVWAPW